MPEIIPKATNNKITFIRDVSLTNSMFANDLKDPVNIAVSASAVTMLTAIPS